MSVRVLLVCRDCAAQNPYAGRTRFAARESAELEGWLLLSDLRRDAADRCPECAVDFMRETACLDDLDFTDAPPVNVTNYPNDFEPDDGIAGACSEPE